MSKSEPRLFDFREIAALDDTAESFRNWIGKSSSYFLDYWSDLSGYGAQVSLGSITTESYGSLLETISRDDLCVVTEIQGFFSSQWYSSAKELRKLAAELLLLSEEESQSESPLTHIESSLVQMCLERLAEALGHGWMGEDELKLAASAMSKDPRKSRLFRAKDLVTKARIDVQMKNSTTQLNWLLPKQPTCDLMETTFDQRAADEPVNVPETMVEGLPVELVSSLGRVAVSMSGLSDLKVGQLLILDQRIDQPVKAYVDGEPFYECWPGRLGSQQALKVEKCLHR